MGEASEPSEPFERSLEGRGVASSVAPWTQGGTGGTGGEMLGLASSKSGKGRCEGGGVRRVADACATPVGESSSWSEPSTGGGTAASVRARGGDGLRDRLPTNADAADSNDAAAPVRPSRVGDDSRDRLPMNADTADSNGAAAPVRPSRVGDGERDRLPKTAEDSTEATERT